MIDLERKEEVLLSLYVIILISMLRTHAPLLARQWTLYYYPKGLAVVNKHLNYLHFSSIWN